MAIAVNVDVLPAALWPQGDIRDPLGVWGFRRGITGDASGGSIKVTAQAPAGLQAAYVYACYSLTYAMLTGTPTGGNIKTRLLANWPDIDTLAGVQGYGRFRINGTTTDTNFTAPIEGFNTDPMEQFDRFILLFDPRPGAGALDIVEMEGADNVDLATYSFEGYGYFWDRSVLQAPGGPRHPGSS